MRFVVDGMLGKTARFLRMLGNDVKYFSTLKDRQLIEIAKREHRFLLTRDLELYQRAVMQGTNAFLVEGKTEAERLAGLAKQFGISLEIDVTNSRCPKCNAKIKPIEKKEVIGKVPKTTLSSYDEFWECSRCGQIYWRGAHWKRIKRTLKEAEMLSRR